jgi:hypothetical protein
MNHEYKSRGNEGLPALPVSTWHRYQNASGFRQIWRLREGRIEEIENESIALIYDADKVDQFG